MAAFAPPGLTVAADRTEGQGIGDPTRLSIEQLMQVDVSGGSSATATEGNATATGLQTAPDDAPRDGGSSRGNSGNAPGHGGGAGFSPFDPGPPPGHGSGNGHDNGQGPGLGIGLAGNEPPGLQNLGVESGNNGAAATAPVTVTVTETNDPPVANDDATATGKGVAVDLDVLANDTDPDAGAVLQLNSAGAQSAQGASVWINDDGTLHYDPTASATLQALTSGQSVVDSITYDVVDQHGAVSGTATVSITVNGAGAVIAGLIGTAGDDIIYGTNGADNIDAAGGNDVVFARGNADTVSGGTGNDVLFGESGADTLNGDDGNDALYGGSGDDILNGGAGNDVLDGEAGNDQLFGNDGDDLLIWDPQNTVYDGGTGTDTVLVKSGHLDVAGYAGTMNGIERVELIGSGNNTVTLSATDVINMSDTDTLTIVGNGQDHVVTTDTGWADLGVAGGVHQFFHGATGATLLVDQQVDASGVMA
jgi:Ca2+-binding RTX toxin-like protein